MQLLINVVTIRCGISKIIEDITNLFQSFEADAVAVQIMIVIKNFLGVVVNETLDKNIENFAGGGVLNSLQVIQRNVFMPVAYLRAKQSVYKSIRYNGELRGRRKRQQRPCFA